MSYLSDANEVAESRVDPNNDAERRTVLRAALTGAIAAIAALGFPRSVQAQTRTSLASLQNDVNNLNTQLGNTNTQLTSTVGQVASLATQVTNLTSQSTTAAADIDALETALASIANVVDGILSGARAVGAVDGLVRVTPTSAAASAANAGALRFDTTSRLLQYNDGVSWTNLATGQATMNQAAFYVYLGSTLGVTVGANLKIPFSVKAFDDANAFNTSSYAYTVPSAGTYQLTAVLCADVPTTTSGRFSLRINKNGNTFAETLCPLSYGGQNSVLVKANVGDFFEAYVSHSASSGIGIVGGSFYTRFYGYKLS